MTLREVQQYSLEILKDVHEFCESNNIRYSIAYGTLIGAIRHKGFIPWDDDIDIVMPRPDYDRFCQIYKSKRFSIFSPLKGDCYLQYARVCDLNETYVQSLPWCNMSPTGLWIDVFPLDGVADDASRDEEYNFLKEITKGRIAARDTKNNLSRPMPLGERVKTIIKKCIKKSGRIEDIVRKYEAAIVKDSFETTNICSNKSVFIYWKKDFYPKNYFEEYTDVEFEGLKFKATAHYDKYLTKIYGDYMQLPPVEKRVCHPQTMYWK